jgi:threonine synthase
MTERATTTTVLGLKCRECGKEYPKAAVHVCEMCFGPLEVAYDYDALVGRLTRETIARRPGNMWRYAELLPLDRPASVGAQVGWTPLVRADRLARRLGVREAWVKNDAVCFPSLSFKDRVVAVALSKAIELGMDTVGCASTGNLANSVAANAAAAGLKAYVLIPEDLEAQKIIATLVYGARVIGVRGTYDDVNRLCSEIAGKHGWGFVNVNLRPFYAEGSKTFAYELVEQLGWRAPDHIVAPMAGGSLLTKIRKALGELDKLGLTDGAARARLHGAQAAGCAPIVTAVREGQEHIRPIKKPDTIAKSLAIGNPADGYYAMQAIRASGGFAAAATDAEIVAAMRLLAETEGIFTETAGGVTLAATQRLIAEGRIGAGDSVAICITGQGLKTTDPLVPVLPRPPVIAAKLSEFDALKE